jgi:hypothetical protein
MAGRSVLNIQLVLAGQEGQKCAELHLRWSTALTVCGERLGLPFGDSRLSLSVPNSSSASCVQHRRLIRGEKAAQVGLTNLS